MKICSYNILTGANIRCGDRRRHILEVISDLNKQEIDGKESPIDILVLQEANDFDSKENEAFMKQIQERVWLEHTHVSSAKVWEGNLRYNTVIYSRWPILEIHDFHNELSNAGLCMVIDTKEFGKIGILAIHLSHISEDIRLKELGIIIHYMEQFDKKIILGDFNSLTQEDGYIEENMDSSVEKRFDVMSKFKKEGYLDTSISNGQTLEQLRTYPTPTNDNHKFKEPTRIDYILTKNLKTHSRVAGIDHSEEAKKASDHYPIWTIIE